MTKVVNDDPHWIEAASLVVFDAKDTRDTRLAELKNELRSVEIRSLISKLLSFSHRWGSILAKGDIAILL